MMDDDEDIGLGFANLGYGVALALLLWCLIGLVVAAVTGLL